MDRRTDPRTDAQYSLRNLLRLRSVRRGYALAVLATCQGVLMAGSREDRSARRAAAHAAHELFPPQRETTRISRVGERTGGRLSGVRFEVGGKPLVLAVVEDGPHTHTDQELDQMVGRVRAILQSEPRLQVMAA